MTPSIRPAAAAPAEARKGAAAALASYLLWGFLPLLFHLLESVGALTIVADRTIWSLLLVGAVISVSGQRAEVVAALRNRALLIRLLMSAVLLAGNWLLYVWAVEAGKVLEASFGYFINPLVNVALGMVLLGERQNPRQAAAIAIAVVAIGIQAIGMGSVPFVAIGLALSFGFYGFLRKTVPVSSTSGLFIETLLLAPVALLYLGYTFTVAGPGPHTDPMLLSLLILCGPGTAVPLLLFAYGVRRLRLTTIGMFQYIAPSIQFVLAITFFGESLNPVRLLSFALIWMSLALFSADSYWTRGRPLRVPGS